MNLLMLLRASLTSFSLLMPEPAVLRILTTLEDDDEVGEEGEDDAGLESELFSTHWFQYLRAMGLDAFSIARGLGVIGGGDGDLGLVGVGLRKYPSL